MKPPLTPERVRELATAIARQRALQAIKRTLPANVAMILNGMDDVGALPEAQFSAAVDQVADLLPDAQITVMFPHLYVGQGDGIPVDPTPHRVPPLYERGARVRLLKQVEHCGPGCEGIVRGISATIDAANRVLVDVDGYGLLRLPPSALELIDNPRKEA